MRDDMSAFVWIYPYKDGYAMDYKAWLPFETVRGNEILENYVERGWLTTTEGDVIDKDDIAKFIIDFHRQYGLTGLNYDIAQSYGVITQLAECGIPVNSVRQNCANFNAPMTEMARLIETEQLYVRPDTMLVSQFLNTEVYRDTGNSVRPIKRGTGTLEKIDIPVAACMALAFCAQANNKNKQIQPLTKEGFDAFMNFYNQ